MNHINYKMTDYLENSISFSIINGLENIDTTCLKPDEGKKHYSPCFSSYIYKKPLGTLLTIFLNTTFNDFSSFAEFINKVGMAGLVGITEEAKIYCDDYTINEYKKKILTVWEKTKCDLFMIQSDFKYVIDKILEYKENHNLNALESFYITEYFLKETNIEKYNNGNLKISFDLLRHDSQVETEDELIKVIKEDGIPVIEKYMSDDISSILYMEFKFILTKEFLIKQCPICKNYFIPTNRSDEIYCDNCKLNSYEVKIKSDEALLLYRSKYQSYNKKINKPNCSSIEREKYKKWAIAAKVKRQQYINKKIAKEEFIEWLKNN